MPVYPSQPETVYYVATEAACDSINGGWYYDDPNAPHVIMLCPATCNKTVGNGWSLTVEVGCPTIS